MNKINKLQKNDKVAIVSLSSGILGESFIKFELDIGIKRLKEFGLIPVFMPNALKGLDFIKNNPEARAQDLKEAFLNPEIKAVICAIGGVDTYRTYPYLMTEEFKIIVQNNPKIFMGFSDTTANHLMFQKLGLNTFYGPAFLPDFAELANDMLPYTKDAISYLFEAPETYEIKSSPVWYKERESYSPAEVGKNRVQINETKGFECLQGTTLAEGKLLGGCLDVLASLIGVDNAEEERCPRYDQTITSKFNTFPTIDEWKDKIMFFETSDAKMPPEQFESIIKSFKQIGIFNAVNGVLVGKPIDETYYDEYKQILIKELKDYNIPVLYNLNFGHAVPRTIIPYGALAKIDPINKTVCILNSTLK